MTIPKDFGYTDDHELLRKTARRLFSAKCAVSEIRRLADDDIGFSGELYQEMAELGWLGLVLPESVGGADLDTLSLAMVLEEMGRCLLPSPFLGSVLAALAIRRTGGDDIARRWLPDIVTGKTIATIALSEPDASWEPESVRSRAERTAGGYALSGTKTHVMWGQHAGILVAPFLENDERALFAIELPRPGVTIEPEVCIDGTRRTARITLANARVDDSARIGGDSVEALRWIHTIGFVMTAAELLGCSEAVLSITRDYANERIQFARPIGSFQAVKHPIVNVMIDLEMTRSLVVGAAAALDHEPERAEMLSRMAKASATDSCLFACDRGIQTHGGFGFTWDCDVHFYYKRALWGAATLGDGRHHRRKLAEILQDLEA